MKLRNIITYFALMVIFSLVAVAMLGVEQALAGSDSPEGIETFELDCLTCIIWPDGSGDCYDLSDCNECVIPTVPTVTIEPTTTPGVEPTSTPGIDPTVTPEPTTAPKANCGQNKDHDCGHGNDGDQSDNDNPHGGPSQGQPGSGRDEEQGGTRGGRNDK